MPSRGHLYSKLRAAARHNSAIFAKVWREGVDPGAHQYEMARRVDSETIRFQADFWPRDHGKSEIFCIAYPLRQVCEDPDVRILIIQKTATEAEKTLQVIKTELERNRELKSYYAPHWEETVGQTDISNATGVVEREGRREGAWQQRRIYVKRNRRGKDPTIEAVGVGGAITGGHFDIIILDDVEDDENTKTADRLRSMVQWFNGTVMQLREPHTKMIVVGTLKTNAQDIYKTILDNPVWNCRVVRAILEPDLDEIEYKPVTNEERELVGVEVTTPGVKVLWPQRWPIEELLFEMLGSVRSIWIREKLNDLRALAGQIFKKDWFRYYDDIPPEFEQIIQIWDTAWEEKEAADWSACTTLGLLKGQVYVLDVFREKLETPGLLAAMKAQYARWKPREVVIEDRASGKSAIQVLKVESKLPVVAISPGGRDKAARARAVTPYYESGRVLHRAGAIWLDVFEDELLMFPEGENDDQVDTIVYGLLRLFLGEGEAEKTASAPAQVVRRDELFG
jgi:predicted phage terminase large subunit-like protein